MPGYIPVERSSAVLTAPTVRSLLRSSRPGRLEQCQSHTGRLAVRLERRAIPLTPRLLSSACYGVEPSLYMATSWTALTW